MDTGGCKPEAQSAIVNPQLTNDNHSGALGVVLGLLGVAAYGLALFAVQPLQFKVVSYTTVRFEHAGYYPPLVFVLLVFLSIIILAGCAGRVNGHGARRERVDNTEGTTAALTKGCSTFDIRFALSRLWPLLLGLPLACYSFVDKYPPFTLSFLVILGGGWAAFEAALHCPAARPIPLDPRSSNGRAHGLALCSIILLIVLLTVVHTKIQVNFFEHFMLGHSDIGHFTEELKNALAGRGLRSDSFENTRFGWHFVPLMYALVPGYALWPSPVYLMVCSALVVHLAALPVFYVARRLSGSVAVGWMWAVAWLLLPSLSRLVYANTYGFQWSNVAMPLVALMIAASLTRRWRIGVVMAATVLLSRETAAAAVLGWGLYVTFFTPRRKTGVILVAVSVAYAIVCINVLIPYFSEAGRYERLDMFGELGTTAGGLVHSVYARLDLIIDRLLRREVFHFLLILIVPMGLVPVVGWRMAVAALPTFLLIALLDNEEWLSIKFWHQATILPFLFFAAMTVMQAKRGPPGGSDPSRAAGFSPRGPRRPARGQVNFALAAAVLVSAALGHYFYGYSPISKAYEPYAANAAMHQPDPRLETVQRLRADVSTERTILATERLAAHFTDYKRLYTGRRIRLADYVLIDRADTWDTSGLPQRASEFADRPDYHLYGEFGSIVVFQRDLQNVE